MPFDVAVTVQAYDASAKSANFGGGRMNILLT